MCHAQGQRRALNRTAKNIDKQFRDEKKGIGLLKTYSASQHNLVLKNKKSGSLLKTYIGLKITL